jgi:maltose/moltooligosaccharide transporter
MLSFWQIWNMCFGFLGIQIGFALQNANMSRIFQTLGAELDGIALLWIAAPVTGLLVQPLIGYWSDRTWNRLGRRRPYFLAGAILASVALVLMPQAAALWQAAGLLWLLDASLNISMEPFRAFVGDQMPESQRARGYVMQGFFIGTGAVLASALPWLLEHFGVANTAAPGMQADTVRWSFQVGAVSLLGAVLWTVLRSREYSPAELAAFGSPVQSPVQARDGGEGTGMLATLLKDLTHMPATMRRLVPVQFFTWLGLFAMWIYTTAAVTQTHFGGATPGSVAYNEGANWVGVLFAAYSGFAALAAAVVPVLARRLGTARAHLLNLWLGAAGLASFLVVRDPHWLILSMAGVGIAWCSVVSLPYALLAGGVPSERMGTYMGIFNFFIVIPQIVAASVLGFCVRNFFDGQAIYALLLGALCWIVAGLFSLRVEVRALRAR